MKSEKILVTGGLGYIGSHTVVELMQQNFTPIIVDNLSNSRIGVADQIRKITGIQPLVYTIDICNRDHLLEVLEKHPDIRSVIHFAAFKAVGESVEKPIEYYHNNVNGLLTLLQCMAKFEISRLVFSSSCTVYGNSNRSPVNESTPVARAASPYGNTKIICEDILRDYAATGAIRVESLRYFNPVGAHPSALIGELPIGVPGNLVPFITQTAAGIREQLTVFGNDYNTPDGTCIRDYIHVSDIAAAHVQALARLETESNEAFEVFNLGTGTGHSVLEVVHCFEKVSGVPLNYKIGSRRAGDVEQIWASTEKATHVLGWEAVNGLEEMLLSAWEWQKRQI